ncbi:TetR/AcrR family transcriptional regulator [Gordonia jinhuaensis]|uniref:HTH-type transcriptional regulator n=1 Tax=Gordonia jinhuaensis TaxID=1517702 RepID=A0A916SVR5_9ACTN|nr:putative HTH-type transcriptional regulator [Gordonia jinhuaensis]
MHAPVINSILDRIDICSYRYAMPASPDPPRRAGRRLDRSRDAAILTATLEILAEVGYEATTVDAVAARAHTVRATVYRRWPTKADLVVAAVGQLGATDTVTAGTPDTGTLRGDLLASIIPMTADEQQLRIDVMTAVADAGRTEPKIAALSVNAGLDPWVQASKSLFRRAIDRGEFPPGDIDTLASVIPTMCVYRIAVDRLPVTRAFVITLVDDVVLPALRGRSDGHPHSHPSLPGDPS